MIQKKYTLLEVCRSTLKCFLKLRATRWLTTLQAVFDTADAESLVSSFRRMLRGVCDGEVLLDNKLGILASLASQPLVFSSKLLKSAWENHR